MTTQTKVQERDETAKTSSSISGDAVVGYAVLGCLVAGTLAVFKAMSMEGIGAAGCFLAAVAAFGTVCHIYFRR